MAHGDDAGLVLPPRLAPIHVAIVPIWRADDPRQQILDAAREVQRRLVAAGLVVELDDRDGLTPGAKYHEWELLGVPLRIELGPKDLAKGSVMCVKRTNRAKTPVPTGEVESRVQTLLDEIQREMFEAALARREAATFPVDTYDEFKAKLESPGGFLLAHWCGNGACEERVKEETKATIRCLAFDQPEERGRCIVCGGASTKRAHFAKAY
jgi:prolyl-tRNA synthetase